MNIGDRVVVTNPKLKTYLTEGVIQSLRYSFPGNSWEVLLETGKWITIKESNLEKVTEQFIGNVQPMENTDNSKYLAFVHYHDYDRNPESIEDALDMFNEEDIGSPELTVYGTKEEILDRIADDDSSSFSSYENAFIIINQTVYPLKKSVTVDW